MGKNSAVFKLSSGSGISFEVDTRTCVCLHWRGRETWMIWGDIRSDETEQALFALLCLVTKSLTVG